MRNIFEDSCTEEGKVAGKDIFKVMFKFSASEARKKFNSTDSGYPESIERRLGSNPEVIGDL